MSLHNTFVATYAQQHLAKIKLGKMQKSGFDLRQLRIVSQHSPSLTAAEKMSPIPSSFGELEPEYFCCIQEHDLVDYEVELGAGRLFILAHGTTAEVERAKNITDSSHPIN